MVTCLLFFYREEKMSLLEIENISHTFGEKILYKNVTLEIYKGEHVGIIGENGAGKSTLLKILLGEILPDHGRVKWQPHIKMGCLDQYASIQHQQTIMEYLQTAFKELYQVEEKLNQLYLQIADKCTDSILNKISRYQEILEKNNFYAIESTIKKVASGLGINALGFDTLLQNLSGGQRAKVILGKLLLQQPDVLILDEPTNFLDKEHIEWLSTYLKEFKGAFLIVSHHYEFLDCITTSILDIEFSQIRKYRGNYSACLTQKNANKEKYINDYNAQQKEIKKTEEFIAKHIVRATSASMAKDRQKKLARMDILEKPPKGGQKPHIHFNSLPFTPRTILEIKHLEIGYHTPLFPKMNYRIRNGEKIVITGFNGIGKSTLLKTLLGIIPKISGNYSFAEKIKIAYYEQDLKFENKTLTPIQIIRDNFPKLTDKEIRKSLAQAGLKAKNAMQEIQTLSGGEQAKVNICKLMLTPCHLLVLDEPTNHLDQASKVALKEALTKYDGTLIMVSHEDSFYQEFATKIIDITELCSKK